MAMDLYIQVLVILENDKDYPTNEHKAKAIRKLVDREIVDKFQELIADYQKECGK